MTDVVTLPRLQPTTAADTGQMLREASERQQAVVIRGNGTKAHWSVPATRHDVVLSTLGLRDGFDHCAGDLIVTSPVGLTLADVNARLATEGQWLPIDPWAGGDSTIGGLLATNDSGPRRHRYGAPRDLVIGVEFALVDGRLAKAGGRVVKNVAGYDLGRLLCGSFGTLAVITAATFKLSPRPPASRTVVISTATADALSPILAALAVSPLTPSAVEIAGPPARLLVRFETTDAAAEQQATTVFNLAGQHGADATLLHGAAEDSCWVEHAGSVNASGSTLLRLGVLPSQVTATLSRLAGLDQSQGRSPGLRVRLIGRALLGALTVALDGPPEAVAGVVRSLREQSDGRTSHLLVLGGPAAVTDAAPRSSDLGGAANVMRAVKAQFDPRGTLCPGGGPGGLA